MTAETFFPVVRKGHALELASPAFVEEFEALKEGVQLMVARPVRARSPEQHAWFWAVLSAICKAGAWDGDPESLLRYLKMKTNFGDWYPMSDGRAIFVPKSISFSSCDQTAFNSFVRDVEKVLAEALGIDTEEVFKTADRLSGYKPDFKHTLELTATVVEKKEETKALPAPPMSIAEQLTDLALRLDSCASSAEMNDRWAKLKQRADIKALWKEVPQAVEDVVGACRDYARGKISRLRFNEKLDATIASAKGDNHDQDYTPVGGAHPPVRG